MASVRFAGHRAGTGCQTGRPVLFRSGSAAPDAGPGGIRRWFDQPPPRQLRPPAAVLALTAI